MNRRPESLMEQGVPVLTCFGDRRSGIMYKHSPNVKFVDGTIDWIDEQKTRSGLFVGRCVVVRTYHDRYFAVGQNTVAMLGELRPEIPAFGNGRAAEVPNKKYSDGEIPALTIGEPWDSAIELAGDSSHVDFAHVDWSRGSGNGRVARLGERNYFDAAREILAQFEPDAIAPRE